MKPLVCFAFILFCGCYLNPMLAQSRSGTVKVDTALSTTYFLSGKGHYEADQLKDALIDLNKSVNYNPKNWIAYAYKGFVEKDLKMYKESIESCNKAIALNAKYFIPYGCRAEAKRDINDLKGAIEDYSIKISHFPKAFISYTARGWCWNELNEHEKALEDFNTAITLKPKRPSAYLGRGCVYYALKKYRKSVNECTIYLKLNGEDDRAYFWRGASYLYLTNNGDVGKVDSAVYDLNRYANNHSNSAEANKYLGMIYSVKTDTILSSQYFKKAISLEPKDMQIYFQWGIAKLVHIQYDEALKLFQKVIEGQTKNGIKTSSDVYEQMGLAQAGLRDTISSLASFNEALKIDSNNITIYLSRFKVTQANTRYRDLVFKDLSRLIQLQKDSISKAFNYSSRSFYYFERKDIDATFRDSDMAIKLAPEQPYPYLVRAFINYAILREQGLKGKKQLIYLIQRDTDKALIVDKTSWEAILIKANLAYFLGDSKNKICDLLEKAKSFGGIVEKENEDYFCRNMKSTTKDNYIAFDVSPRVKKK